jgi:hypothetical protein
MFNAYGNSFADNSLMF